MNGKLGWARALGRRVLVTTVGGSVLAVGIVFIALPFIPGGSLLTVLGLLILAKEWPWARRPLEWARTRLLGRFQRAPEPTE
ncbi:MAG TPA: PGPGW domain-containing protein [Dehalococcoidia bacterium]|nr:PGPGW domain-containing protein [Dehalococcoidia bacterium]